MLVDLVLWLLVLLSLSFSIWYNYHHFKVLLGGRITLHEVLIAAGSIFLTLALLGIAIVVRFLR